MSSAPLPARSRGSQDVSGKKKYTFPPGLDRNLIWYAWRRFRPQNPILLFQHLAEKYGRIAHYRVGPARFVFVNDPRYIQEVLVVQAEKFTKERTQRRSKMLLGEGMITAEGAAHRKQRQIALPAFHRERMAAYSEIMVARGQALCEEWREGETIDVAQEMMRLTLDIISRALFGVELGADVLRVRDAINRIMGQYHYLVALPAAEWLVHLPVSGLGRFKRARARVDEAVYRMIDARVQAPHGEHGDLLSLMLGADPPFSRESLRDQVVTIFLAGYETVANALTWTWYLLAQNQDAEEKLHQELARVLGSRAPRLEDVPQLRYTEMVFSEAMRLYPPAWAMGRQATQDFVLGEFYLPRGTTVLMSQFILHRDAEYFPEPLAFRPERFAQEKRSAQSKAAYFPFGFGARRCIGESFAWMEGVLLLATMAQRWKLRLAPGHPVEPDPLITLRPKYGMRMMLESRL